jgi:CheY-like chemotaxis protein
MCHVLIIEDEWFNSEYLADLACDAGATSIVTAFTEDEAVSAARERTPAIILPDVKLVAGTGPGAVRAITAEAGEIPVIFITATPRDCAPYNPPGVILPKPIQPHLVVDTMRHLIRLYIPVPLLPSRVGAAWQCDAAREDGQRLYRYADLRTFAKNFPPAS